MFRKLQITLDYNYIAALINVTHFNVNCNLEWFAQANELPV